MHCGASQHVSFMFSVFMNVFSGTPQEDDSSYMCLWVILDAEYGLIVLCPFGFIATLQKAAVRNLRFWLCKQELQFKQVIQIAVYADGGGPYWRVWKRQQFLICR